MADALESMRWAVEEAKMALHHARSEASKLRLPETELALGRALSHIENVLFETQRKTEPEFARFRDPVGTPSQPSSGRTD